MATTSTRELCFTPAETLAAMIRRKDLSPVELMEATLARIEAVNPTLNAFIQLDPERGLREAREQADRIARGEDLGPLGGLPFGVKELENAEGFRTTQGSRAFADRLAARDDVHVARLRAAGAICIGKTNSPEFGYTAFTTNEVFGTTRNPWNPERTPGGSSGGAAAAIAAGMTPLATASDGGGSIRIPACFTGTFGHKPTFGLVPIGPREMLPWMDTSVYGPLTRTVRDAALYLDQVAGYHPADPTSLPRPPYSFLRRLDVPLPRLRIAFSRQFGAPKVQSDVLREVVQAAAAFQTLGHEVEEIEDAFAEPFGWYWVKMGRFATMAGMEHTVRHHSDLFSPDYAAGFDGVETIGPHEFGEAYRLRSRLNDWLWRLFETYDLLLLPTMPYEAFAAEGPLPAEVEGVRLGRHLVPFTMQFNFSGHPAANVRAGFTDAGLPAGLQIVGPRHADELVLRASYAYEQVRPWNDRWPT
jgi:Asp-tRNA(Asn)/Glu-tRNA(Gln) amidotransferase A subunit family amidase